jgi:hypothetical protein
VAILIAHRYGIGSFYYTLFSWKTQASFGEFGQHIAPESDFWIETSPFSAMYIHHEYSFGYPDLWCCQSDAIAGTHKSQHTISKIFILVRPMESGCLGFFEQYTFC